MPVDWITVGVALLVVLTGGLVVVAMFLLWRSGYVRGWHASRKGPPTCTQCGYNLTGLRQCRCPECGREHTLDELWRASVIQPRSIDQLETTNTQAQGKTTSP